MQLMGGNLRSLLMVLLVLQAGAKKPQHKKCALCEFLSLRLASRVLEEAAKDTKFEMGWRLRPDGTRSYKEVLWAHSELGFGAEVEASCERGSTSPLAELVQLQLGEELSLREPADAAEAQEKLGQGANTLELYSSQCIEFIFSHEDALDPLRNWRGGGGTSLRQRGALAADTIALLKAVCGKAGAGVCPSGRWVRWYGEGATQPKLLPLPQLEQIPTADQGAAARNRGTTANGAAGQTKWTDYFPGLVMILGLSSIFAYRALRQEAKEEEELLALRRQSMAAQLRARRLQAMGEVS